MNLKDMLNQVLSRSGFLQQDSFATATDVDTIQMVAFANVAAQEILNVTAWNKLRKSYQITMVAGQLEYDLPADFDQYVTESMWKASGVRWVMLPTPERLWGYMKAGSPASAFTYYAKFIGGKLAFTSVTNGDVIQFDYMSKYAVASSVGTPKEYFTNDTDNWLLSDNTLISGIQAFWKIEKEMPSAVINMKQFKDDLRRDIGTDNPSIVIRGRGTRGGYPCTPPIGREYLW